MAHPVARATGRSLAATLLTMVLVPVIVVLVFGLPALAVAVLPVEGEVRLFVYFGGVLLLLCAFVVAAIGFAMMRTGVLDDGFSAIGMRGRSVIPNIRNYTGQHGGRVTFGTYARRGGLLELGIEQSTGATAAFTRQQTVGRVRELIGLSPLSPSPDPVLAGVIMAAGDPVWTTALLGVPGVASAVATLLHDPSGRELRWVLVRPGCVKVTRRWIDPDAAGATLPAQASALDVIATACTRLGPPAQRVQEGAFERRARQSPMSTAFAVVGCLLLFLVVPTAIGAAVLIATTTRSAPSVAPAPGPSEPAEVDPGAGPRRGRRQPDRLRSPSPRGPMRPRSAQFVLPRDDVRSSLASRGAASRDRARPTSEHPRDERSSPERGHG